LRWAQRLDPVGQHAAALAADGHDRQLDDLVERGIEPWRGRRVCLPWVSRPEIRAAAARAAVCSQAITRARKSQGAFESARIVHHIGAVETRAEHGRIGDFAAIAAADAALVDAGHRIVAQRIVELLQRQRRAAR
jgi:hypothetical protein